MEYKQIEELAKGLKNSNIPEVSDLAKAFLKLYADYGEVCYQNSTLLYELTIENNKELLKRLSDET